MSSYGDGMVNSLVYHDSTANFSPKKSLEPCRSLILAYSPVDEDSL
ncbi:12135_t:CDS:1, partial [Acaulospora colombiana]